MTLIRRIAATMLLALGLAACVVYEPVPVDPMERPWQSAVGAFEDAGLPLTTVDRPTGTLRGKRGDSQGTILVRMRNDGRVGVEITASDAAITQRLTDSYNRRMGR